ncbi:Required for respiratory growth protein 9 mitochondrial [Dissophora globulifera]|nr:Required for respiratory growth protein 9 mitochondrial [Dissophora globulifera]
MQEARRRWGIGSTNYASIISPAGRPEVLQETRTLTESRIAAGHAGQRLQTILTGIPGDEQSHGHVVAKLDRPPGTESSVLNPHLHHRNTEPMPRWLQHKLAIKEKLLGKTWNPQRKLSRQAMEEVRYLRKQFPEEWTTPKLAEHFNVASESIVRILRTDFQPSTGRLAEQDLAKERNRKANLSANLEKIKSERHAAWQQKKFEREKVVYKTSAKTTRIRLGAPTRNIGSK